MSRALVTGADTELGRAFAARLAAEDRPLVLVGTDRDALDALAGQLRSGRRVDVEVLTADLGDRASWPTVTARLADDVAPVGLLVNASVGAAGAFLDADPEARWAQEAVDVGAVLALTRAALPVMLAGDRTEVAATGVTATGGIRGGVISVARAGRDPWACAAREYVTTLSESLATTFTSRRTGLVFTAIRPDLAAGPETVADRAVTDHARGRLLSGPPERPDRDAAAIPRPLAGGTALVTGASSGIGAAFATRLATDGHHLVLVARDEARLRAAAERLTRDHGVEVEVLVADLAAAADRLRVERRLTDPERPVDVLVNSAGYTTATEFVDTDPADLVAHLDVNVGAVVGFTRAALPGMIARGRGAVIAVSSVAGFLPGRGSVYGAGKAAVTALSRALALDASDRGVQIMALCPGFTRTEFHARIGQERWGPSWMWMDADDVVQVGLADLAKGEVVSVPGVPYQAILAATRVVPRRLLRSLASRTASDRG